MFLSTWLQTCFVILLLSDVSHDDTTCHGQPLQLPGDRTAGETPCAEGLCRCSANGLEAQCSDISAKATSLPALPESVRVLKLSFGDSFVNLTNRIFFRNASRITSMYLLRSQITSLNKKPFLGAKQLTSLYIEYEFVRAMYTYDSTGMDVVAPLFTIPTLRYLNANDCFLEYTPNKTFPSIGHSNIEVLHLERNSLGDTVNLGEYEVFKRLKRLYLSFNGIYFIKQDRVLEVKELYLDNNGIFIFPDTCQGNKSLLPTLEILKLNNNRVHYFPAGFCLPRLKTLHLDFNSMPNLPADIFSDTHFPSLTELHAANIHSRKPSNKFTISRCAFCNRNLTFLNLAMTDTYFTAQVHVEAFARLPRLHTLLLDHNNFTEMNDTLFHQLFGHLSSLLVLSLSDCHFNTFTKLTFTIFPGLSQLNLSNNGIIELSDGVFDSVPNLTILDLSKNKLSGVRETLFSQQFRLGLLKLYMNDNRFQCSCDLMWFAKWMVENPDVFGYPGASYDCRNLPGTDIPGYSDQEHACLLKREVNVLIIFSSSLMIISLTVLSLVYRYRWHVRLLLYEVFRGRDTLRRQQRLQNDHFDYDVFVSYASEDLPWIKQRLMPKLEGQLGLRLCIHERDFIPGKNIVDNIADCVQSSKKILMVYSNHFVGSQWCQFELMFCLGHVMDFDDALIIVCVDDVASRRMTSAMMAVLKTTTYIQWADRQDADYSFWRRLCLALHEVLQQVAHV